MDIHTRDSVGRKKRGIHFAEMGNWHGGREGRPGQKVSTCSGKGGGQRQGEPLVPAGRTAKRKGMAEGELAQVGWSQRLQTLIEHLVHARCCECLHKALVMIYALRNSL